MGRRIIRTRLEADSTDVKLDGYFDKLMKYIPSEIIGAWIAIKGLIKSASGVPVNNVLWILFIILTGLTAVYIFKQISVPEQTSSKSEKSSITTQVIISTLAFIVWAFAIGDEPFSSLPLYQPVYGSIILILFNLIVPLI
jgi:putative Mn2+ efflux pump MntP